MNSARGVKARAVAFYLPQYFPIPENDKWWGKGFTEWTNTAKARRLFPGHKQPNLPSELGFYDLRVSETRVAQAEIAREHGVEAFVYWHYWFGNGDRILERPFTEVLESGEPDFPFALAWANQSWTGIWHGAKDRVLKQQLYPGDEDDRRHFQTVLKAFRDARYLRVADDPSSTCSDRRSCRTPRHSSRPGSALLVRRVWMASIWWLNPVICSAGERASRLTRRRQRASMPASTCGCQQCSRMPRGCE